MSTLKDYTCEICQKKFSDYPSQREARGRKAFFCSRQCKYTWNKTQSGYWKGKKMSESAKHNMSVNHSDVRGENNPRWCGGKRVDKDGYVLIWKKEHPFADYHGYVREHRLVVESKLGRFLDKKEVVHHKDGNKTNNKVDNLYLYKNGSSHQKHHYKTNEKLKNSPAWKKRN